MTSRRAQRRDGSRRDRRDGDYWVKLGDSEYERQFSEWLRLGPFRPLQPPGRFVPEPHRLETE